MDCYNSYVEIDCRLLCNNIQSIRADIGEDKAIIPVLKCNAYGLGMLPLAQELAKLSHICRFAVAQAGEALTLRQAGIKQALMVMGGLPAPHIVPALAADVELTLYNLPMAQAVAEAARALGKPTYVHIKVETGLNRLGIRPGEELDQLIQLLRGSSQLRIASVYSHFVDAEIKGSSFAPIQLARYMAALSQFEAAGLDVPLRHICNSSATESYHQAVLDGARIGRRLYMDSQRHPHAPGSQGYIEEVASWRSQIINLRLLKAGETTGYNRSYVATGPTMIATIPVGYGDGLDERLLDANAPLLVTAEGHQARYLAICMDQSLIDVSGIACKPGDEVTFYGRTSGGRRLSAQRTNAAIHHEGGYLSSLLGQRVQRRYINKL